MAKRRNRINQIGIYINSCGRAENVRTIRQMPDSWKEFCSIVTTSKQSKLYSALSPGWNIISVPKSVPEYLSSQRQWVIENCKEKYVWFMDDDLTFQTRYNGLKLKDSKEQDMEDMLELVYKIAQGDEIPLVSISTRLRNNVVTEDYTDVGRVMRCYMVNKEIFHKEKLNFAPFESFPMEDFHITISFLKAGYKNRIIYKYAQCDQGSNTKGGCSRYRTPELMEKSSNFLKQTHKDLVDVKIKKTKGGWEGFPVDKQGNTIRTDVVIHWKKAYEIGKRRRYSGNITSFFNK